MAYDHSNKCGNEGDLVKHAVLANIVSSICEHKKDQEFVYFESHAGFPNYALQRQGEWGQGILDFWKKLSGCSEETKNLSSYKDYGLTEKPCPGFVYPGSTDLVRNILRSKGKNYRFIICDYQNEVCAELNKYFKEWAKVTVIRGDGFDIINYIDNASLALIDPAYFESEQDYEEIQICLKKLNNKNIPFMCWVPILKLGRDNSNSVIINKLKDENENQYVNLPIEWKNNKGKLDGCLITVSKDLEDVAKGTVEQLKEIMQWTP